MKTINQLLTEKIAENQRLIALNDTYIHVLRDLSGHDAPSKHSGVIKPQSAIRRTVDLIREAGRPLHANEIVVKLGKKMTRRNKVSIASSMSHYANAGKLFRKVDKNTFDIIQTKH